MILVTGGTGTVGSEVAKQLVAAGQRIRVLVRAPEKGVQKLGTGVELAKGDFTDAASLDAALRGADKLFLLAAGADMMQHEANAVDAAKRAGVKHIVKLSVIGAESESTPFGRWHRAGEKKIEASGVPWTFLRPTGFASNALMWVGSLKAQGTVFMPTGDGKLPVVDPKDIAAVAVHALTKPGHEGRSYDLTGPEALSTAEQVQKIGAAVGKSYKFVDVPEAAARDGMLGSGMPAVYVDALLEYLRMVKAGQAATVSTHVEKVTGKKARTFDLWLADNLAAFR